MVRLVWASWEQRGRGWHGGWLQKWDDIWWLWLLLGAGVQREDREVQRVENGRKEKKKNRKNGRREEEEEETGRRKGRRSRMGRSPGLGFFGKGELLPLYGLQMGIWISNGIDAWQLENNGLELWWRYGDDGVAGKVERWSMMVVLHLTNQTRQKLNSKQ